MPTYTKTHHLGRIKRKKCLWTCAICADCGHPVHAQSIIRISALHSYIMSRTHQYWWVRDYVDSNDSVCGQGRYCSDCANAQTARNFACRGPIIMIRKASEVLFVSSPSDQDLCCPFLRIYQRKETRLAYVIRAFSALSIIWASARQNLQDLCYQQRLRSACTSIQYRKGSRLFLFE